MNRNFDIEITKLKGYESNKEEYGHIYLITNGINGKQYVGYCTHKINSKKEKGYTGGGTYLINAKKEYGIKNFAKEIIHICYTEEMMLAWEMIYKRIHRTITPNGYNIIKHSEKIPASKDPIVAEKISKAHIGKNVSKETRQKQRLAKLGKKQSKEQIEKRNQTRIKNGTTGKGRIKSVEEKAKISATLKGRPKPEEFKEKVRATCRTEEFRASQREKRKLQPAPNKGRIFGSETREKSRLAKLGRKQSPETIKKRIETKIRNGTTGKGLPRNKNNKGNTGKKAGPESIKRMSNSAKIGWKKRKQRERSEKEKQRNF